MASTTLTGASGKIYVFKSLDEASLPDVPGLVMLTDLRGSVDLNTAIGPSIGFVLSLSKQAESLYEEEKAAVVHSSAALVCPTPDLRTAWIDLRQGGAKPLPGQATTEPYKN